MAEPKKDALVEQLWNLLVRDLIERLENGEQEVTKDGEVVTVKAKASTLSVIAKFLKDNEIKALPDNPETDRLAKLLAKASEDLEESILQ
jgi:hypothetical protein